MKGTIYILAALLLFGCAEKKDEPKSGKPSVFVSIPPQAGLAKAVAGDLFGVSTLVGEGQSPHAYEPTARQLAKLGEADALFTIGVPFETALLKKIVPLYPDLPIVGTEDQIRLRDLPHAHHGEACTHDHGAKDPHVWLNPLNALAVAESMYQTLEKIDPSNSAAYRSNFKALSTELENLDAEIRAMLKPHQGARFYVFHPSFGYFADAYGLQQVPIELDGKSPSPRQLATLIEQAQEDGVKVVFVQKQFPAGSAKAVADAIGGRVVQLDPLAEDVVANLRKIAESIVQALEQ
ncbi:metal ABC transporter solute-binding protein, Zn/Mn family [Pontiella sulfatireligans]|uniref:Manganese ABC transporter substrate-binding lipoprotein n=1 Tax=Pontiella sulfatireligans TaxID=2750658 RepID=A0A6C2UUX3_9BACT|nr:zinc ABC transporter substrate-binding protein [Pontiella sulfatireligans]VGO22964.1 Manganese ABC transporter substrate-binding lipoprotein [Pontiella sulfatireligans]